MDNIQFDEVLEFDETLYQKNINDHTFSEPDELDGRGKGDVKV